MQTRTSIFHRIVAVFIAVWIPFCCCTLRSAAAMVQCGSEAPLVLAGCCGGGASGACATDDGTDDPREEDGHCTSCCVKAGPDRAADWVPEVGLEEASLAYAADLPLPALDRSAVSAIRARAPDPPPCRSLHHLRSLFIV